MRMQRWALTLLAYTYDIQYRVSKDQANADFMSRLPTPNDEPNEDIYYFSLVDDLPITSYEISRETVKDPILSGVLDYTLNGWPGHMKDDTLKPYFIRKDELTVDQNCVLWGLRVIIPIKLQAKLLDDLHTEHPGMVRMKSLARSYLWWPCLDKQIEEKVSACTACGQARNMPSTAPLHVRKWPSRVLQRIHIDFAESKGKTFLVLIDAYSKWLEVFQMHSTTSTKTIEVLRHFFASYGLPESIVSDNGPQFTSSEFKVFCKSNGINQILVPAYHPASNGAAERSVQILKKAFLKHIFAEDNQQMTLAHKLDNFLLMYRNTPHSVSGRTPSELFLQRQVRTRFTLLKPNLAQTMEQKQSKQKYYHDNKGTKTLREFATHDFVQVRNFAGGRPWLTGKILKRLGPLNYLVQVGHKVIYVHVDHILSAGPNCDNRPFFQEKVPETQLEDKVPETPKQTPPLIQPPVQSPEPQNLPPVPTELEPELSQPDSSLATEAPLPNPEGTLPNLPNDMPTLRRSVRIRKPVEKLNLFIG